MFHSDATLGPQHLDDPFYVDAVSGPLTRNIGARFADIEDEIAVAFDDHIRLNRDGKSVMPSRPLS